MIYAFKRKGSTYASDGRLLGEREECHRFRSFDQACIEEMKWLQQPNLMADTREVFEGGGLEDILVAPGSP